MRDVSLAPIKGMVPSLLALSIVSNLAILVSPIFMMQVLDRVVPTGNLHTLVLLLIVALGALVLQAIVEGLRNLSLKRLAHWVEREYLPVILAGNAPLREVRLNALAEMSAVLSGGAVSAALTAPWLPFFLLVLWVIHPWFLAVSLMLVGVAAAVRMGSAAFSAQDQKDLAQRRNSEASARQDMGDVMSQASIPVLVKNLMDRFAAYQSARTELADQMEVVGATTAALSAFLRSATQLVGLSLGASLVVASELSAGGMIAASLILTKTVTSFEMVVMSWGELRAGLRAYGMLNAVSSDHEVTTLHIPELSGALKCEGLIFPRGGGAPPRLDRISFELTPGSCLAIVGASGSGKTTLIEALSGTVPSPIGSVFLDESEVKSLPLSSRRDHIGYLPQQGHLFRGSLAENICGFEAARNDDDIIAAAKTAGVHGLISALPNSYETDIGVEPYVLSAGQKQRVALARAIFHTPTYLFLDEPNALLDALGERQLCATLARLKTKGTTIVMIVHRSGVMALADYVLAMDFGRVTDFGPRAEVLGRLSGGRRRIVLPLNAHSTQDLVDWVHAQFSRGGDTELAHRAEIVATELYNLVLHSGERNTPRTVALHFGFLSSGTCEITLVEDAPTEVPDMIEKVSKRPRLVDTTAPPLPSDEVAIAAILQMTEEFDVQNSQGQSKFRARLSMDPHPLKKVAQL